MADVDPKQLPGCGLAAFAMLLLSIFLVGVTGISVSTYSMLTAGKQLTPEKLAYGGVVDPRMLESMRASGILGADEIPDAYHAENPTGSEACAVSGGRVLRVGSTGPKQMKLSEITAVGGDELEVTIDGPTPFSCRFAPGEGGDRFKRMLENR